MSRISDLRAVALLCALAASAGAGTACTASRAAAEQQLPAWSGDQPIAFRHDRHIQAGMVCTDCHTYAAISPQAGIPSVKKCALCHSVIATENAEIKKVMAYAAAGREIPWQRVYGFDTDAHVRFRHDMHIFNHIACSSCHGDMSKVTTARVLVTHNMGTCVTCHRQQKAPTDCWICHY